MRKQARLQNRRPGVGILRAHTLGVTDRTSSGCDLTLHHELRPIGHPPDAAYDRAFLLSLGIEPFDPDSPGVKAVRDPETVLINALAVAQFLALLAGLVWTYLRLS